MTKTTTDNTAMPPAPRRLLRIIASLLVAVGIAIALFLSRGSTPLTPAGAAEDVNPAVSSLPTKTNGTLLAYSVDYEMDKARAEKTIEHYGEGMRPIVEDALDNNEKNPESKATAENSYERESALNDILPEKVGESFAEEDLVDMEGGDGSKVR